MYYQICVIHYALPLFSFTTLLYHSTVLTLSKNFHNLSRFNVKEMGSQWATFLLYLVVLSWPEDGRSRPKHVAKYHLTVIITTCLMYVAYWRCKIYYTENCTFSTVKSRAFVSFSKLRERNPPPSTDDTIRIPFFSKTRVHTAQPAAYATPLVPASYCYKTQRRLPHAQERHFTQKALTSF